LTSCTQDHNKWKSYVEKATKHSKIEVVAPKEEEVEERGGGTLAQSPKRRLC